MKAISIPSGKYMVIVLSTPSNLQNAQTQSHLLLYENIDQTLMNSLHILLDFEMDGLDCRVITTEYILCAL